MKKKLFSLFLALSMLLVSASAAEMMVISPNPFAADPWGLTAAMKDVTSTGGTLVLTQSGGSPTGELTTGYYVQTGDYVAATIKDNRFTSISTLTKLKDVSKRSWTGTSAVLFGGTSYTVAKDVLCYNLDSKEWVTLEQALAYTNTANLYAKDGIIHIVEVSHK